MIAGGEKSKDAKHRLQLRVPQRSIIAIMSWISKYFYSESIFPYASKAFDFITGTMVYAGGYVFTYLERAYIRDFDKKHRQQCLSSSPINKDEDEKVDWENPTVVGRNRQPAHTVLRAFRSVDLAKSYWADMTADDEFYCRKILLTGPPGVPDPDKIWRFKLVGNPTLAPAEWFLPEFDLWDHSWSNISLPGHWQCQGYDIPIYTNTVYPV